jgi:hypothetical protein
MVKIRINGRVFSISREEFFGKILPRVSPSFVPEILSL